MKLLFFSFLALFTALIVSCENPVKEYGDALISSYEKGKEAGKTANLRALQEAIQIYRAANGHYPGELKEIETVMGSPVDVELYEYNPHNGEIKLKKQDN